MAKPKIIAFAGSTRTDSFNKKLVKIAAAGAKAAGADVTLIDLRDYPQSRAACRDKSSRPVSDFLFWGTLIFPTVKYSLVDSACSSSLRSDTVAARCRQSPLKRKSSPPAPVLPAH